MTPEALKEHLSAIDAKFKSEKLKHDQIEQQLEASDTELKRLQGEFRAITSLIETAEKSAEPAPHVGVNGEGKKRG
jgi:hypothetical protein